nr:pilus motility taxis protein HmpF [Iningainema tapete]
MYLAEVQKQKGGLLGSGAKTELKLLACQRTDQSWSTASEEAVAAEEANKLNDGVLVLVEMNNRQVQRIQEASRPLVNVLQNFSRQVEKFKHKEEEIDQWKQSLTFQAQELNRREMDFEARLEQLQNTEVEIQRLEGQKQELETSREEIEQLRQEIARNRQELEGAWEHLRGEQRRLEEYGAQQPSAALDSEQIRVLTELCDRLCDTAQPQEAAREHLNFAFEMVESQQALLNPHWQKLEQQRIVVNEQQVEIDHLAQVLLDRQNEWEQAESSLWQHKEELAAHQVNLNSKQEFVQTLTLNLQHKKELYQQIHELSSHVVDSPLEEESLQNLSDEALQKIVQEITEKLKVDSSFVDEQEQELQYKQQAIEELQNKLNQASVLELAALEEELADEKDLYQMLNETLVGQRRSLVEKQEVLQKHQAALLRRQGMPSNGQEAQKIDLKPILAQIETQRQQQSQVLQNLESEIEQIQSKIEQTQESINAQTQQQSLKRQELQTMEQNLLSLRKAIAESWGGVNLYQEMLQPIQDSLDGLRHKLQGIGEALAQAQATGEEQLQAIAQLRQTLSSL